LTFIFAFDSNVIVDGDVEWRGFKLKHSKRYSSFEEESRRREIWRRHLILIEEHNRKADAGLVTYRLKMNEFGDLTSREFVQQKTGYTPHPEFKLKLKSNTTSLQGCYECDKKNIQTPREISKILFI
jgi:hypothetical protein